MKITVLDYSTISKYQPSNKTALIRIGDELNEYHLPKINENLYESVHLFQFFDIVPKVGMPSNWNPFSIEDGKRMLSIFKEIKESNDYDEFVVHCFAGVSRSPAVAIAFAWYVKQEEVIDSLLEMTCPNAHVLETLAKLMNIYEEKREFIQTVNIFDEDEDREIVF